jgi:hypothetical protein
MDRCGIDRQPGRTFVPAVVLATFANSAEDATLMRTGRALTKRNVAYM